MTPKLLRVRGRARAWDGGSVRLSKMWVNGCFSPSDLNNSSNGRLLTAPPDWLIRRLRPVSFICSDGGELHHTPLYFPWIGVSTSQLRICFEYSRLVSRSPLVWDHLHWDVLKQCTPWRETHNHKKKTNKKKQLYHNNDNVNTKTL